MCRQNVYELLLCQIPKTKGFTWVEKESCDWRRVSTCIDTASVTLLCASATDKQINSQTALEK